MTNNKGPLSDARRRVPRTDSLLADPRLTDHMERLGAGIVKRAIIAAQELAREGRIRPEDVADTARALLPPAATSLNQVINATGVLPHTNLGRAPLSKPAIDAVVHVAGTTDLELDLTTGRRGRRGAAVLDALIEAVAPAEAAHVVNNGAAALLLCATALARGREIIVSRGELIEIGDGFRIPDLLRSTGAHLREVGTTNRTTLRDYREAIGTTTAFVLKVHPSNFVVTGFTSSVPIAELSTLDVPVVVDIGSGLLAPHLSLPNEPDATTVLRDGATLVTASGDKLLGGPQAGIILGHETTVHQLRRHPAARALRVDKLTLAALEATLTGPPTPTHQALETSLETLKDRGEKLLTALSDHGIDVTARDTIAAAGGGAAPGVALPSHAICLPACFAATLRTTRPAVIGYHDHNRYVLDLRTVQPYQDCTMVDAIVGVLRSRVARRSDG